jgi:hypothetical protein
MFPVLEPFGSDLYGKKLKQQMATPYSATDSARLYNQLIYQQLYDSTTFRGAGIPAT